MPTLLRREGERPLAQSGAALTVAAVGVVFGDIGTSPLYALRACFAQAGVPIDAGGVLGVLSLVFWALALVIGVKYVGIVLRADNEGEGGVLALMTLVLGTLRYARPNAIVVLGLVGCALFYGDGVITPAVTVLGALEGIAVANPRLEIVIVPASLLVLWWLFTLQRRGTGAIGNLFGPLMLVWFATLAALGLRMIAVQPAVLGALNPFHAAEFFAEHAGVAFAVLGAVFLAVTGGEALYADLGHFGRKPIVRAWFAIVWPCLLLNYFGQGALLLENPAAIDNPFYMLAPEWALLPLLLLATAASIIASQAVISGVFAITQQCRQLGYIPRVRIEHASETVFHQVYVPAVNWLLCVTALGLVLGFRSSGALASAYGVGVSCTMLIDALLMIALLQARSDRWSRAGLAVMCVLVVLDAAFVASNLLKIPTGGWFPLVLGAAVFFLMRTWQAGRLRVTERMHREERDVKWLTQLLEETPPVRVPRVAVFLTGSTRGIPRTLVRNLKLNGVLHEHTVIFTVVTERVPRMLRGSRVRLESVTPGVVRVIARIGFMEMPRVPELLKEAERAGLSFRTDDAVYFVGHDDLVVSDSRGMARWRKLLFVFLAQNSQFAGATFAIPRARLMEVGGQVEI